MLIVNAADLQHAAKKQHCLDSWSTDKLNLQGKNTKLWIVGVCACVLFVHELVWSDYDKRAKKMTPCGSGISIFKGDKKGWWTKREGEGEKNDQILIAFYFVSQSQA